MCAEKDFFLASAIAWQRSSAEKYAKWANFISTSDSSPILSFAWPVTHLAFFVSIFARRGPDASKSQVLEERARGVAVTHALAWITVQQDYLLSVLEIINTSLTDRRHSRAIKSLKSSGMPRLPQVSCVCVPALTPTLSFPAISPG